MGYMENSYSNSNNGGSVNSQDSLWQMKMAAQANNAANMAVSQEHHHHHLNDRNNPYGTLLTHLHTFYYIGAQINKNGWNRLFRHHKTVSPISISGVKFHAEIQYQIFAGVYDPLNHGGYGTVDDYAPYPHLMPSATPDYSRSNNPSRQEYSQDKTLRQHHMGTYC